jgi:hypothetical protein
MSKDIIKDTATKDLIKHARTLVRDTPGVPSDVPAVKKGHPRAKDTIRDIKLVRVTGGVSKYPVVCITLSKEVREVSGIDTGDRVLLDASDGRIVITREE